MRMHSRGMCWITYTRYEEINVRKGRINSDIDSDMRRLCDSINGLRTKLGMSPKDHDHMTEQALIIAESWLRRIQELWADDPVGVQTMGLEVFLKKYRGFNRQDAAEFFANVVNR